MVDIEIKKDGHKVVQPYAPVTELRILETIHRKGVTIVQVAERLGVTKAAVSQMITGNPTLSTIYKIAWAIDVYPRDFFYRLAPDGSIIEEPKVSFEKLKEYAERERFGKLLQQIPYLRVLPTQANFFCCQVTDRYSSAELTKQLLSRFNIMIKDCDSKNGLKGRNFIRLSVRATEDNDRLIEAFHILAQ